MCFIASRFGCVRTDRFGRPISVLVSLLLIGFVAPDTWAAELAAVAAAARTITKDELKHHVEVLADDALEGREAGTRGGHAAAVYLRKQLVRNRLKPLGTDGDYFQYFQGRYRNVLAMLEGTDPELQQEFILVGAHYDHVGYGQAANSYGPLGFIHNGADDNASGTAGLLELIEAIGSLPHAPRRSIVFAFWDGEEKGLLGSKHYVRNPSIPLSQTKVLINMDMIGRLRNNEVMVYGSRSGFGMRHLVCQANDDASMTLDFTWELKDNSDHYPFFQQRVPVLMLHTGLHDDYHRPRDDAHKINASGMQRVVRLLFNTVYDLANRDETPAYRAAASYESPATRQTLERPLPPLRTRLGVRWDPSANAADGVVVTGIKTASPAESGGVQIRDRILQVAGKTIASSDDLVVAVVAAKNPVRVLVRRDGEEEPIELTLKLRGKPHRVGISWREDSGDPGAVILSRVVPGSPAAQAGLRARDRIYEVSGQRFLDNEEFQQLLRNSAGTVPLLVERAGRVASVNLELEPAALAQEASPAGE